MTVTSDLADKLTLDNLIASYGDGSGHYRIYVIDDILVTRINDDEVLTHRMTRAEQFDGDTVALDPETQGSSDVLVRADWMLTDRFGSCPDAGGEDGLAWVDGLAYTLDYVKVA